MAAVDLDKYKEHFADRIATRLLTQEFPDVYEVSSSGIFEIQMRGRLEYGRGGPKFETTLKALQDAGVIKGYSKRDVNHPSFYSKPDYRYFIEVIPEWYEEYAKAIETKPEFEIQKTVTTYDCGRKEEKVAIEKDGYLSIDSFKAGGTIHILNHMDEYDFILEKRTGHNKRVGNWTRKAMKCFPKGERGELAKEIFNAHVEAYLKEHFEWIVKLVFGIKENIINQNHPYIHGYVSDFNKPEECTIEKIKDRIDWTIEGITYFQKVLPVLEEIQQAFEQHENSDIFAKGLKLFKAYLEECYPCHLDDEDEDLKQLAQWMMLGKHEGQPTKVTTDVA